MDIYVLIPVFNRLHCTKKIIKCLREQTLKENLKIYVVDDGSKDGTGDWLNKQFDINIVQGNGKLFWSGAINLGLRNIFKNSNPDDWLLLINNDVLIKSDYVESLFKIAKKNYPAAIGSIIKNKNGEIVSVGPKINTKSLEIKDLNDFKKIFKHKKLLKDVDALSGRGVIYPLKSIVEVNGINQRIFPHYFADYELSLRIKKKGYNLMLSKDAYVLSDEDFDLIKHQRKIQPFFSKLSSKKSPSLIYSKFFFWWEASNNMEKITLPLRIILFIILPVLRKVL